MFADYSDTSADCNGGAKEKLMAMTVGGLIEQLKRIVEVHPEADDAMVWGCNEEKGFSFPVTAIGYDKRHKPARIKLE